MHREDHTLMGGWIFVLPALQELEELFGSTLLKKSHERTLDSLHLRTRNFRDLAVAVNKTTSDLLEFEIPSNIRMDENLSKLPRSDNELGNEVHGVVTVATKVGRGSLITPELPIKLRRTVSRENNTQDVPLPESG
jgi:hypothetical protein